MPFRAIVFIETTRNANGNLSHLYKLYAIEREGAKRLHIRPHSTRECSDMYPWPKSHDEQEISSAGEYGGNFVWERSEICDFPADIEFLRQTYKTWGEPV